LYDVKTGVLVAVACRYTAVQICMQLLIFACLIIILIIIIIIIIKITTTNNNNKNDYFENYCKAP